MKNLLAKISSQSSDAIFETSDGRHLPVFKGFGTRLRKYKGYKNPISTKSQAVRKKKLLFKWNKIRNQIKQYERIQKKPARQLAMLDIASGIALEPMIWAEQTHSSVTATDISPWFLEEGEEFTKHLDYFMIIADFLEVYWNKPVRQEVPSIYLDRGLHYYRMDSSHLQFEDNSFDVVTSYNALLEIPPLETTLREIFRVLKPGGLFFAIWDNFFYLLGAHKKGCVDIPWGHALLSRTDFFRFAEKFHPENLSRIKQQLVVLNPKTALEWFQILTKNFEPLCWMPHFNDSLSSLLPIWMHSNLPKFLAIDDLIIENYDAIFLKPL